MKKTYIKCSYCEILLRENKDVFFIKNQNVFCFDCYIKFIKGELKQDEIKDSIKQLYNQFGEIVVKSVLKQENKDDIL